MDRRNFLALGAAALAPGCGEQAKPKIPKVVWMGGNAKFQTRVPVAFAERGFKVGESLSLDFSSTHPGYDQTIDTYDNAKLREIVAGQPDVLVVHGTPEEVLKLTREIPTVFYDYFDDPQVAGYVSSLRRPGGNTTGATIPPRDLLMKQLQIMKLIRPRMKIFGLIDSAEGDAQRQARRAGNAWFDAWMGRGQQSRRDAAAALGLAERKILPPKDASAAAIASAVRASGAEALIVAFPTTPGWMEFVKKSRTPTLGSRVGFERAERGEVMISWGFNPVECETQAVSIVARILRGESPATIPVYVINQYAFAVNRRLGREAGIEIPASVLVQADKIFDS